MIDAIFEEKIWIWLICWAARVEFFAIQKFSLTKICNTKPEPSDAILILKWITKCPFRISLFSNISLYLQKSSICCTLQVFFNDFLPELVEQCFIIILTTTMWKVSNKWERKGKWKFWSKSMIAAFLRPLQKVPFLLLPALANQSQIQATSG